jgi:hypothetical protein
MSAPQNSGDNEKTDSDAAEEAGDAQHWEARVGGDRCDKTGENGVTNAERDYDNAGHECPLPSRKRLFTHTRFIWVHDLID